MATKKSSSSRRRSPARPAVKRSRTKTVRRRVTTRTRRTTRRTTVRRTIALPGGLNVNVNKDSISLSTRQGPLSGTWSSTGRRSVGMRLPGGITVRQSG